MYIQYQCVRVKIQLHHNYFLPQICTPIFYTNIMITKCVDYFELSFNSYIKNIYTPQYLFA